MSNQLSKLGSLTRIRTGKLDANANDPDGDYPFFTCAVEPLRITSYSYDCECVLVAGNGDLNVKYYNGKFDAYQRTYIIESLNPAVLNVRYLYHFLDRYLGKLRHMSIGGVIKYIKLGNLADAELLLPTLPQQTRIAAILDQANAMRVMRREAIAQLDRLTQSIFIEMFGDPVSNPKGWKKAKLGDMIFSASDGPHVSPKYSESGVPFLSARHVRPSKISWDDLKYISNEEAAIQWKKCKPEHGDILYTKGGTTGFAAVVNTIANFAVWVHVALLKVNPEKADSVWLESMLNSNYCYRQSQDLTHGIANRDLGLKRMCTIGMYQPPIALQQEFSLRASMIEKLKSAHQSSLAELENLFTSLQHRAFRGEL